MRLCSTVVVTVGGSDNAGIVVRSSTWKTMGFVTFSVRHSVPAGNSTSFVGTAASVISTSPVAADALSGVKFRSLASAIRFFRCVAVTILLSLAELSMYTPNTSPIKQKSSTNILPKSATFWLVHVGKTTLIRL